MHAVSGVLRTHHTTNTAPFAEGIMRIIVNSDGYITILMHDTTHSSTDSCSDEW
jgi:hypothetical protein